MGEREIRTLGAYVRVRRERSGKTLTALAIEAELSKSELSALENGKIGLPGADKRRRLANALGVSHLDILIAAGEITEDEVKGGGIAMPVTTDPRRQVLLEKISRVPLYPDLIDGLNRFLDFALRQDLPPAHPVNEIDASHDDSRIIGAH